MVVHNSWWILELLRLNGGHEIHRLRPSTLNNKAKKEISDSIHIDNFLLSDNKWDLTYLKTDYFFTYCGMTLHDTIFTHAVFTVRRIPYISWVFHWFNILACTYNNKMPTNNCYISIYRGLKVNMKYLDLQSKTLSFKQAVTTRNSKTCTIHMY